MDDLIKISARFPTLKVETRNHLGYLRFTNELFTLTFCRSNFKRNIYDLRINTVKDTMHVREAFNAKTISINQVFDRFVKVFKHMLNSSGEYPESGVKGLSYIGGNYVYIRANDEKGEWDIVSLGGNNIDFIDEHVHMKSGKVVKNLPTEVVNELKRLFYEGSTKGDNWVDF